GVEHRMLASLGELAQQHHLHWVDAHFLKTAKNKPALDFLESVGAEFKQALNGGLLFRFPAGFAAEVAFNPQSMTSAPPVQATGKEKTNMPAAAGGVARKFARCRAIALEFQDPVKIHETLQANTVVRAASQEHYTAPHTELERTLCELWQQLLHVKQVGVQDNFFALGGHSLLAVRLFAEVEKLTGRKLPLVTLFQAPTVEELARVLSQNKSSPSRSLLVPIQPHGSKPPLFLVHGAGGDVLWGYANLAAYLDPDQPVYGIKSRGQVGLEEYARLEEMAACYLQAVRTLQPQGPYYLGGYCFGGNVAYEMARQLQAQGEQVGLLALLDSAPSNAGYEQLTWWRPDFGLRFARNVYYWLQDFAALKPRERRTFFQRKLRALGRKLKHRLQPRHNQALVDLEDVIDLTHFPENELKLWRIHLQALVEHVEQPYPGQVMLLRTRGQPVFCSLEEDFCWGKLAQGGVILKRIPGSHENIFMEPNVKVLAQELTTALAQAHSQGATPAPSKPVSS
ncbi:MAG TPA: alpha/beta fold hydrolase, partial [Candidatus Sulfotelmatobacter sp.]|nr:alpha/beta fold hydrolase [Candidatus Sulfotelmatobacter sp.]